MQTGVNADALYNEYLWLQLVFPTLNGEQTNDKIWAKHFSKIHILHELNKIVSFPC
jgi:hypothetical protein